MPLHYTTKILIPPTVPASDLREGGGRRAAFLAPRLHCCTTEIPVLLVALFSDEEERGGRRAALSAPRLNCCTTEMLSLLLARMASTTVRELMLLLLLLLLVAWPPKAGCIHHQSSLHLLAQFLSRFFLHSPFKEGSLLYDSMFRKGERRMQ